MRPWRTLLGLLGVYVGRAAVGGAAEDTRARAPDGAGPRAGQAPRWGGQNSLHCCPSALQKWQGCPASSRGRPRLGGLQGVGDTGPGGAASASCADRAARHPARSILRGAPCALLCCDWFNRALWATCSARHPLPASHDHLCASWELPPQLPAAKSRWAAPRSPAACLCATPLHVIACSTAQGHSHAAQPQPGGRQPCRRGERQLPLN